MASQRMLSLWLPRLATDRIARSREDAARPDGRGLVTYGKRGNLDVLTAVDDAAARRGLSVGLALAQARAMHPALKAVSEDPQADADLLEHIADWGLRYTPLTACDAAAGFVVEITGRGALHR